jgi:hypothetical protein
MKSRAAWLGIFGMLMLAMVACGALSSTPIGKIIEKPRDYAGKSVTISGEVGEIFSLFVVKYFTVRDATGELAVVTSRALPRKGSKIEVTGRVEEAFSIGDKQLLVLIESDPKK